MNILEPKKTVWNKCTWCGKFIPYLDFQTGEATSEMITPDSLLSYEEYEVTCKKCKEVMKNGSSSKR